MRKTTLFALMITGAGLIALLPAMTDGQQGRGGKGGFGGGGFGGGGGFPGGGGFGGGGGINANQDPNVLFEFYAKGRSYFLITESNRLRIPLTQYAQDKGITSGQITRQQFLDFFDQTIKGNASAPQGGGGNPPGMGGGFAGGGFPGGFGGGGFPGGKGKKGQGGDGTVILDPQQVDAEFRFLDKNSDGKLNKEEMPRSLRDNLDKWDKDRDGLIDIVEYRAYAIARWQGSEDATSNGAKGIAAIIIDEEDLDRRTVVYRVGGKQMPGLPDWFNKLDTDKDGMVALYEWRVAKKPMDEFKTWDLNDDGFITPEEAAKVQIQVVADDPSKGSLARSGYQGGDGNGNTGRPNFGAKGPKGGPPGGNGGNGGNPYGQFRGKGGDSAAGDNPNGGGKGKGGNGFGGKGKGKGKGGSAPESQGNP